MRAVSIQRTRRTVPSPGRSGRSTGCRSWRTGGGRPGRSSRPRSARPRAYRPRPGSPRRCSCRYRATARSWRSQDRRGWARPARRPPSDTPTLRPRPARPGSRWHGHRTCRRSPAAAGAGSVPGSVRSAAPSGRPGCCSVSRSRSACLDPCRTAGHARCTPHPANDRGGRLGIRVIPTPRQHRPGEHDDSQQDNRREHGRQDCAAALTGGRNQRIEGAGRARRPVARLLRHHQRPTGELHPPGCANRIRTRIHRRNRSRSGHLTVRQLASSSGADVSPARSATGAGWLLVAASAAAADAAVDWARRRASSARRPSTVANSRRASSSWGRKRR